MIFQGKISGFHVRYSNCLYEKVLLLLSWLSGTIYSNALQHTKYSWNIFYPWIISTQVCCRQYKQSSSNTMNNRGEVAEQSVPSIAELLFVFTMSIKLVSKLFDEQVAFIQFFLICFCQQSNWIEIWKILKCSILISTVCALKIQFWMFWCV